MLKIILADNQAIFRAGAAKVLAVEDDFRVVAQADTPDKLFSSLNAFRASVLIFSGTMQVDIETLASTAKKQKTRLVAVADNDDRVADLLKAGVHGVIYRNVSGTALVECIRKVGQGESWVQDHKTNGVAAAPEVDAVGARVRDRLTAKELKIVALIVQGYKNKEIATKLGTTEQVIKNYLRNVYDKIGVSDRLELALFTIHHKMLLDAAAATGVH